MEKGTKTNPAISGVSDSPGNEVCCIRSIDAVIKIYITVPDNIEIELATRDSGNFITLMLTIRLSIFASILIHKSNSRQNPVKYTRMLSMLEFDSRELNSKIKRVSIMVIRIEP